MLVFRVGEDVYACEIDLVREVVRLGGRTRITRIPKSPAHVRGLLNVRGEVLSVLDVGLRLHPERPAIERGAIMVVTVGTRVAGVVVEDVLGVKLVPPDDAPKDAPPDESGLLRHLGHLDGKIVLQLDVRAFVNQSLV